MRGRAAIGLSLLLIGAGGAWAALRWRDQAALAGALRDVEDRRYARARAALTRLVARDPGFDRGQAAYALGLCEQALGRPDAAQDAWRRVPADSPFAPEAAVAQARHALRGHRFAEAEPLLRRALDAPGTTGLEARQTLAHILKIQGRLDEVVRLFQEGFDGLPDLVATLRELWRLQGEPYPADEFAQALAIAAQAAPEDDRVWLGRANLAIRNGRLDEADRWLSACERRRANDPAVTRARLDWAIASGRPDVVADAAGRLDDGVLPHVEVLQLRAWLARIDGDREAERAALSALDAVGAPGRSAVLERLADLHVELGRHEDALDLRRRKAALDQDQIRYHDLLYAQDPPAHAVELSRLAARLGWRFEAARWATLGGTHGPPTGRSGAADVASLDELKAALARHSARRPSTQHSRAVIPTFADEAASSGLDFAFANGASPAKQLPETMSGGVAFLDYDGDGWLDVYVVQGGRFPPEPGVRCGDRLYRNNGDGTFADATERAGLAAFAGGYGHGVAVGDLDNDGDPDVLVTRWRGYALYVNAGDGTFADATEESGLGGDRGWPTSAAFADFDGDGDLDLYVCHYAQWDERNPRACFEPNTGRPVYCPPVTLDGEADHLFRNDGGRFVDVTAEAGIADPDYRGMGVVAADLDGNGLVDLFVANDMNPNLFFRNLGGLRFEETAELSGLASNADGGYLAGMGIACGDLDGDGQIDLAVTNFYGECTRLYRNLGSGQFADETAAIGLAGPTRYRLGFGIGFADVNNDGLLDIIQANGHVDDLRPLVPHAMPTQLILGTPSGRLLEATDRAGVPWRVERLGRGLAVGDVDNDGRLDALLVDQRGPLALLRNQGPSGGHFVTIQCVGTPSNRDAVGAVVSLEAGGRRQVAQRFGGGSYQSADDPRLHFGLGDTGAVDRIEVRWPSGAVQSWTGLAADRGYRLVEGQPDAEPLPGFSR
jgi:tetratricopeptide (TPR) repeat protein